jgi:regulator of protease activity HflC (stomatin/prohibitin superfamily)
LLNTELVPAFKETLQATGSLMSAEEYFSGGRTDFNSEFENQMANGIYLVRRKEVRVTDETQSRKASADASQGQNQDAFGDDEKVIFKVEKRYGSDGQPLRKTQNFTRFGIEMVAARVTDMIPNEKFRKRMEAKQDASAKRAVNREQRIEEEERKLLVIAQGEREIAQEQAAAKKVQIKSTTDAETSKRLALIEANKKLEQAQVDKETAQVRKEQAEIDAERIKTLADAEAYQKRAVLEADDALAQKLDAWVTAQKHWAQAFANRKVPTTIFGGAAGGSGSDTDVQNFMDIMTMKAAKDLSVDTNIRDVTK